MKYMFIFLVICEKNNLITYFEHEWIPGCASGIRQDKYQNILRKKMILAFVSGAGFVGEVVSCKK